MKTRGSPAAGLYVAALVGLILLDLLVNLLTGSPKPSLTLIYSGNCRGALLPQMANDLKADRRLANYQETFTFLQDLRQRLRREQRDLIVLHGGDSLVGGDGLSEYFGGAPVAALMQAAGCDALAPGRLEFGLGTDGLAEVARQIPVLGTNLSHRPAWAQGSRVIQRGRLRIGILSWFEPGHGLIPGLEDPVAGFEFARDRRLLSAAARDLRADLVVCLAAVDDADGLAREVSGIDLVIPMRAHGDADPLVAHRIGEATVAPYVDGRQAVGEVAVWARQKKMGLECRVHRFGPPRPHSGSGLDAVLRPYQERFDRTHGRQYPALRDMFLGLGAPDLTHDEAVFRESGAGDVLADLVREKVRADVVFINHRAIHGGFRGIVGFTDIYDGLPFFNEIVVTGLSGQQILAILQRNALEDERYLQMSGLAVRYRPGEAATVVPTLHGKPIDLQHIYRAATLDYLALGAHGRESILNHGSSPLFSGLYLSLIAFDEIRERGLLTRPPRRCREPAPLAEACGDLEGQHDQYVAAARQLAAGSDALVRLGSFYWRWGYAGRARECLQQAVERDPSSADGWLALGLVHRGAGRHAAARAAFEAAARLQPGNADARLLLGWEELETGDAAAARREWQAALRLRPGDERIRELLALL